MYVMSAMSKPEIRAVWAMPMGMAGRGKLRGTVFMIAYTFLVLWSDLHLELKLKKTRPCNPPVSRVYAVIAITGFSFVIAIRL